MKILVIEEDTALADSIEFLLQEEEFESERSCNGDEGRDLVLSGGYDLLILDEMAPGPGGIEVTRQIREEQCGIPIILLTSAHGAENRIRGLDAGADYCLARFFNPRELLASIRALTRRQGNQVNQLTMGNTSLDLSACMLVCEGKKVRLSAREFNVMRLLFQSKGNILSKEIILARVWGYESNAVENHVEVYVGFLRKKLRSIGSDIQIEAERRLGYRLEVSESGLN